MRSVLFPHREHQWVSTVSSGETSTLYSSNRLLNRSSILGSFTNSDADKRQCPIGAPGVLPPGWKMSDNRETVHDSDDGYTVQRRIHEISGSYVVALPRLWCQGEGLRKGDTVAVTFKPGLVRISPKPEKRR